MADLEDRARAFATNAHGDQKRKYTFEPYIVHPEEVANIVRSVPHTEEMLAAAWLHDTVEDAGSLVRILKTFHNEETAYIYAKRLNDSLKRRIIGPNVGRHDYTSVLSEGLILAELWENKCPDGYPERRPHYE